MGISINLTICVQDKQFHSLSSREQCLVTEISGKKQENSLLHLKNTVTSDFLLALSKLIKIVTGNVNYKMKYIFQK